LRGVLMRLQAEAIAKMLMQLMGAAQAQLKVRQTL